jgi:hypothetical protein
MKNLLGDIKGMLSDGSELDSKNIVDISKNLSDKYQTMIDSGEVKINDLLGGVFDLLSNPDTINNEFTNFDATNLPNPSSVLQEMTNDPNLKDMMAMMGKNNTNSTAMPDLSMLSSMMSGLGNAKSGDKKKGKKGGQMPDLSMLSSLMSGMSSLSNPNADKIDNNAPSTISDLEKEIERMLNEVNVVENKKKK